MKEPRAQAMGVVNRMAQRIEIPLMEAERLVADITTEIQAASNAAMLECRRKHGPPTLRVKLLHPEAKMPTRAYQQAAAFDLYALETAIVNNYAPCKVRTGISLEIPKGYFAKIETRSGIALTGVFATGGVIDADYRGEVHVILNNPSDEPTTFSPGERIAQMLILPVFAGAIEEVQELSATERGDKGFGSTGR